MKKYEMTYENCRLFFRMEFFQLIYDLESAEHRALNDKCFTLINKVEHSDPTFIPSWGGKPTYNQFYGINRFSEFLNKHFSHTSFVFNIFPRIRLNWTSHSAKKYRQMCRVLEKLTDKEKEIITRENLRTDKECGHNGAEFDCYAEVFWSLLQEWKC